jgi:mannose-6-phosphate isomerase-like protein (cupin superfamily)
VSEFATKSLPPFPDVLAPDGAEVRVLHVLERGGMAHFKLAAGAVSRAVRHRTVEEIWYVVGGRGRMWRRQGRREEIVELYPGVALTLPLGTAFQFRNDGVAPLEAVAVTLPPWPGECEAEQVDGAWPSTM